MGFGRLLVAIGLCVIGCRSDTSSVDGTSTGSDDTGLASTSSSSSGDASTSADTSSSSTSIDPDGSSSDACVADGTAGEGDACDYLAQDCAAGSKCVRIDLDGDASDERVCVAAACDGGAIGDPCTRDLQTGADDCSPTTFCAPALYFGDTGFCASFCTGEFTCDDPASTCVGSSGEGEYGCFTICDPLADACPTTHACMPTFPGSFDVFACLPTHPGQTASVGEACYGEIDGCPPGSSCYQCAPGLACADGLEYGPGCDYDGFGCCVEYCELGGAPCSNPLHECRSLGADTPDNADVGRCGLPDDFDWCADPEQAPPGYCPPADADPAYPWCSPAETSACDGDSINLASHCWCIDPCESVDECPMPASGSAVPTCDPEIGCTLTCTDDADCPEYMDCFFWEGELRCLWLAE